MKMQFVFLNVILMSAILIGCNSAPPSQNIDPTPVTLSVVTSTPLPTSTPTTLPATPTVVPVYLHPRTETCSSRLRRPLEPMTPDLLSLSVPPPWPWKSMPGPYSWDEFRSCSTYASAYLKELSFPVGDRHGKYANHPDPLPFSGSFKPVSLV